LSRTGTEKRKRASTLPGGIERLLRELEDVFLYLPEKEGGAYSGQLLRKKKREEAKLKFFPYLLDLKGEKDPLIASPWNAKERGRKKTTSRCSYLTREEREVKGWAHPERGNGKGGKEPNIPLSSSREGKGEKSKKKSTNVTTTRKRGKKVSARQLSLPTEGGKTYTRAGQRGGKERDSSTTTLILLIYIFSR